jgi:hypothetical protein
MSIVGDITAKYSHYQGTAKPGSAVYDIETLLKVIGIFREELNVLDDFYSELLSREEVEEKAEDLEKAWATLNYDYQEATRKTGNRWT